MARRSSSTSCAITPRGLNAGRWSVVAATPCGGVREARAGVGILGLSDVRTLYFETDTGDGFRGVRALQGTSAGAADHDWLPTDATGFPLMVEELRDALALIN